MTTVQNSVTFDNATKNNLDLWLNGNFDEKTKSEIRTMLQDNPQDIIDAFYRNLEFGTGGLRGIMGAGSNRLNVYTIKTATQGLANYLLKEFRGTTPSVFIGYDPRHHSKEFAEESAKVLAANQIKVFLFEDVRPVPMVSFGCRYKKCNAGIMITASHNPPEYNGYKVYWNDGGQVLPPHDKGIIDEVNNVTDINLIKTTSLPNPLVTMVGEEMDHAYLEAIQDLQFYPEINKKEGQKLHVVYSNLHGTGIKMVPKALKEWGFTDISYVESQEKPDGNFPTVHSANPEERATLKLGIELLFEKNGDLLLATDPDCDRVGIAVSHKNDVVLLSGNQVACLCLEHICQALVKKGGIPKNAAFIKTIVTTELFKAIADAYGAACFDVLTGFKYIGEKITQWSNEPANGYQFIFGGEESYGYLLGTLVRDKDAIISSALICEVALQAKLENKTLVDKLHELYEKYGVYRESLKSVNYPPTKLGMEQMDNAMKKMRSHPPHAILGTQVVSIDDYLTLTKTWLEDQRTEKLLLPKSNVIVFHLSDGTKLVVRPSGTEPKIKIYDGVVAKKFYTLSEGIEHCDVLCDDYIRVLENLLLS